MDTSHVSKPIPAWRKYGREGLMLWRQGMANLLARWWQFPLIVAVGATLVLADRGRWDDQVLQQIQQPENAQLTNVARFFSDYGGGEWAGVVAIVLFVYGVAFGSPRWRQVAWVCVLALLVSGIMVNLFRPTLGRARPNSGLPGDFHGPTLSSKFHGFPSGHTTSAFAPAAAIAAASPVVGVPCLIFAGAVGWSRMQVNRHRPLDVMTGAALGTLIGLCFGSGVEGARFRLRKKQRN
jgi:membrane-associated phospholipid phosphatase